MPTEAPPTPPKGAEIQLSDIPNSGSRTPASSSLRAAINAEAAKNAPAGSEPPAPPPDPATVIKTPPEPKAAQPEPPKASAIPPAPTKEPAAEEPKGIKQVREAYERAEAKAKELNLSLTATTKEKADALQRQAELEARLSKLTDEHEKDIKPRLERLTKLEQEHQRVQETLRIRAYTETTEFHDKFVKPLADAQGEVNELLTELIVQNEDGTSRVATMEDFNEVLAARSLNEAHAVAAKKFGPIAPTVVNFRTRIRGLERSRTEAVKEAGVRSAEFEKNQQAALAQQREHLRSTLLTEAQRLAGEAPELSVPEEDQEARATLHAATEFADKLLQGPEAFPSVEHYIKEVAKGRVKMMRAPMLEHKARKLEAKVAELEERLKAYESSEPGLSGSNGGPKAKGADGSDLNSTRSKLIEAANKLASQRA
jgi:hypothetical protein